MNTIFKYIILVVIIIVLFLVGKSVFSVHIDENKTVGEVADDVKAGMGNMATNVKNKTNELVNDTQKAVEDKRASDQQSNLITPSSNKGEIKMAENNLGNAWENTKEAGHNVWEATKEGSAKAWDKTKEVSSDAYDATKKAVSHDDEKTHTEKLDNDDDSTIIVTEEEDYIVQ